MAMRNCWKKEVSNDKTAFVLGRSLAMWFTRTITEAILSAFFAASLII
jgi:hypothetical protein